MDNIHITCQYFLNHLLKDDELREQVEMISDAGFECLHAHSRFGLLTPYFSDAWWHAMDVILEECRRHGIKFAIWDEDGSFLGQVESQLNYFTGNPKYRYIFRIYHTETFDPSSVTIMPLNNGDTATEPLTIKLTDLTYTTDSTAIKADVHSLFGLDTVSDATIATKVHHADVMIVVSKTYCILNHMDPDRLQVYTFYPSSKKVTMGTRQFGNSLETAMAYFTEHNTTIHINA